MFSVLSKAVDFVLSTVLFPQDDEEEQPRADDFNNSSTRHAGDVPDRDQDQQDVLLTAMIDEKEKNAEAQTVPFTGKVTQVFCRHGLIDGKVYFASDAVSSRNAVQVGDTVNVVARQQYKDGGWIAESVTVVDSLWEEEKELTPVVPTGEVGKVTQFSSRDKEGIINKNIWFNMAVCQEGYLPVKGDWVTVELDVSSSTQDKDDASENKGDDYDGFAFVESDPYTYALKVAPLREWCFEGVISAALMDHGYINEEVYFRRDACLNGYRPRRGDSVKVGAIESTQGKSNWRAIYVVPTSSDSSAFRNRNRSRQQTVGQGRGFLVAGQRPQNFNRQHKMSIPNKLPAYPCPEELRQCILDQQELTFHAPCISQRLSMDNYIQRMATLLHMEEVQMELDIQEFSMQRVCLQNAGEYLSLQVPGLEEGRPSVLIGDSVILSSPVDPDEPQYQGIVHELQRDKVMLKFNAEFHCRYNGEDYNVAFTFNRTSLRRCHQAAHLAFTRLGETVLFPKEVKLKPAQVDLTNIRQNTSSKLQQSQRSLQSLNFNETNGNAKHYVPNINRDVQDAISFYNSNLNDRQKAAVIQILLGQGRPLPYIIFGPPGTGKTITVVESILQVLTRIPGSRLVACTPSNSAADLLAERLHNSGVIKMSDMVRLNAFNRSADAIPESIQGYCSTGEKLDVLCRYRIVIATCNTAGLLYTADLKAGHFTHAFVDEAGQATEPECLIPAGLVAGADGQIVLAGDPKQLGPVLMSPFAKMYGLELSFLERLMERLPYQHDNHLYPEHGGFDSALVTMLVNNYRCHSSILRLPSDLFYFGELKECASHDLTHTFVNWHLLPKQGVPLVFCGVRGEDVREGDSPSWFNPSETVEVVRYLQGLLGNQPPLHPDSIGVITPYRKQVEKIRMMIDRLGIPRVKVGSVEEFQGQERQAIIISTVRSNERLLRSDVRHVLGFLSNPKRFNVSITRAQALLVVIGNPHVLVKDEYWQSFIKMCVEVGCYTGCKPPEMLTSPCQQNSHENGRTSPDAEPVSR
ncbi:RNA helicase Mov10l1-like [Littorina saxatilis]|uniref:RNA helicase n=1 Tax=Littorina saxatilis TaxID=31220 RepID=A0AAN9BAW0_9CAEN